MDELMGRWLFGWLDVCVVRWMDGWLDVWESRMVCVLG